MIKKITCLFTLAVSSFMAFSQSKITSDLQVNISEQSKEERFRDDNNVDYTFFYMYPIKVNQTLHLVDYQKDSLILMLKNTSWLNQILQSVFFHNLNVMEKTNNQSEEIPLSFNFNGDSIVIYPQTKNGEISIQYEYQSDFFMKNNHVAVYSFQPQLFDWHSWYFTSPEIKLSGIDFIVPTHETYFFADFTKSVNDTIYTTDISKLEPERNVSFYLLSKKYYQEYSFLEQNVKINLFLTMGVHIDSVDVIRDGEKKVLYQLSPKYEIPQEQFDSIQKKVSKALNKIQCIFDYKDFIEMNIAESHLELSDEEENKFLWGNSTRISEHSNLLLIDIAMWKTHDFIHEIIHPFNKIVPANNDSAHFFFNESMVEYLAIVLSYNSNNEIDSVFNYKFNQFNKIRKEDLDAVSIFKVEKNEYKMDGSSGGTSAVVYQKTPYKIHQLAKSIDEMRFIQILTTFYHDVKKKNKCSFADFEKALKKNGVTTKQWNEFMIDL